MKRNWNLFILIVIFLLLGNQVNAQTFYRGLFGLQEPANFVTNTNENTLLAGTEANYLFGVYINQDNIEEYCRVTNPDFRMNVERDKLHYYKITTDEGTSYRNQFWKYISLQNAPSNILNSELDLFSGNVHTYYAPDYSAIATLLVSHQGNTDKPDYWGFIERVCGNIQTDFGNSVQSMAITEVHDDHLKPDDLDDFATATPDLDIFLYERYPLSTNSTIDHPPDALGYIGNEFQSALQTSIDGYGHCQAVFEEATCATDWHAIIQGHESYIVDKDESNVVYYGHHRRPTEAEIFCQAGLALSRGAKGIYVYIYASNVSSIDFSVITKSNQFIGLVTNSTPRSAITPHYTHVANLFDELSLIGPELVDKRCTAVFNSGETIPSGQYITSITGDVTDGTTRTIEVGVFTDPSFPGRDYFMLVNRLCSSDASGTAADPQVITVNTTHDEEFYRIRDVVTGETYISYNGTFADIVIGPGRCRLFEMCPVFTANETWSDSVHIYCDCTLPADRTLNIQPGCVIEFDPVGDNSSGGRDSNRSELTIYGRLEADGAKFTSLNTTTNDWYGIVLHYADENSYIQNCTIEYGTIGVLCWYLDSDIYIKNNTFSYCADQAIWIDHSDIEVYENTIENGSRYGIYVANAAPYIYDNTIGDNDAYGIYCNHTVSGYIRNNKIENQKGGVRCAGSASPLLIGKSTSEPYGYNVVRNHNWWGFYITGSSQPNLGTQTNPNTFDAGQNCIYDNYYDVKNYTTNTIYAYNNYWEDIPPNLIGTVLWYPYLSAPPFPLSKSNVIATSGLGKRMSGEEQIAEYLTRGHEAEGKGDFEFAIYAYRWVIDNYPETEFAPYSLARIMACRLQQNDFASEEAYVNTLALDYKNSILGDQALLWKPIIAAKAGKINEALELSNTLMIEKAGTELEKDLLYQQVMIYVYEAKDTKLASVVRDKFIEKYPKDLRSFELQNLDFLFEGNDGVRRGNPAAEANQNQTGFSLNQNYPNPFNATTQIGYHLSESGMVSIRIYNMLSQEVMTLINQNQSEGNYQLSWNSKDHNGFDVPSGIYIVRIQIINSETRSSFVQSRKMLLIR